MRDKVDAAVRCMTAVGDELRGLLHPDVELDMREVPDGRLYRGIDEFFGYLDAHSEAWQDHEIEIIETAAAGDNVVVTFRESAAGAASGVHVETAAADVFTIRDGLVTYCRPYSDVDAAKRAAGVESQTAS